jgi:sugar/nucleoside kinase (ribokinase family)
LPHPQFLVVGHVVQDLLSEDGATWRLGGAVSYASVLARNLGLRTAVLTAADDHMTLTELLPDIELVVIPSRRTTQIRNVYGEGGRQQFVPQRATAITEEHLPPAWRQTPIVLLGPVVGEVDQVLAHCFPGELLGVGAQGWLRRIAHDHRVRLLPPSEWDARKMMRHARALFLSDEDVFAGEAPPALTFWSDMVRILAFTRGYGGADVCQRGEWRHIPAFPANVVDPTGAGDVFAAAFLIRLGESGDVWKATRFASCAASFVVEGEGIDAVPTREQIEERLKEYPDIRAV